MDLWEDELTLQKAAREFIGLYIVTPTARATELIIAALNHQLGKAGEQYDRLVQNTIRKTEEAIHKKDELYRLRPGTYKSKNPPDYFIEYTSADVSLIKKAGVDYIMDKLEKQAPTKITANTDLPLLSIEALWLLDRTEGPDVAKEVMEMFYDVVIPYLNAQHFIYGYISAKKEKE